MNCQLYVPYFQNYVGIRDFYGAYFLSYILYLIFLYFSFFKYQWLPTLYWWQLIRGVDRLPDRVYNHGCFIYVDTCHPCYYHFFDTFCTLPWNLIQAISGLPLHVVMILLGWVTIRLCFEIDGLTWIGLDWTRRYNRTKVIIYKFT